MRILSLSVADHVWPVKVNLLYSQTDTTLTSQQSLSKEWAWPWHCAGEDPPHRFQVSAGFLKSSSTHHRVPSRSWLPSATRASSHGKIRRSRFLPTTRLPSADIKICHVIKNRRPTLIESDCWLQKLFYEDALFTILQSEQALCKGARIDPATHWHFSQTSNSGDIRNKREPCLETLLEPHPEPQACSEPSRNLPRTHPDTAPTH